MVFASIDCDRQGFYDEFHGSQYRNTEDLFSAELAQKYHINKYPTLKLFRYGQVSKREYRGQRSPDAIEEFIKQQLDPAIKDFVSNEDLEARIEVKNIQTFIVGLV